MLQNRRRKENLKNEIDLQPEELADLQATDEQAQRVKGGTLARGNIEFEYDPRSQMVLGIN